MGCHGDIPMAGWFLSGKIPHVFMDDLGPPIFMDDLGVLSPPFLGNLHVSRWYIIIYSYRTIMIHSQVGFALEIIWGFTRIMKFK